MQTTKFRPMLHSIKGAREDLGGVGNTKIYDLINEGKLKKVKVGTRSFITDKSIRAYVAELEKIALALILIFLLPFA